MIKKILFIVILFLILAGSVDSNIVRAQNPELNIVSSDWTNKDEFLVFGKLKEKIAKIDYCFDNTLNSEKDCAPEKSINLKDKNLLLNIKRPDKSGKYELWLEGYNKKDGKIFSVFLTALVDADPPLPVTKYELKQEQDKIAVYFTPPEDLLSGTDKCDIYLEGKEKITAEENKILVPFSTEKIHITCKDNVGNENTLTEINLTEFTSKIMQTLDAQKNKEEEDKQQKKEKQEKEKGILDKIDFSNTHFTYLYKDANISNFNSQDINTQKPTSIEGAPTTSQIERSLTINITGDLGKYNLSWESEDTQYSSPHNLIKLNDKKEKFSSKFGNFSGGFTGNEFINFTKETQGVEASYKYKKLQFKFLTSQANSFTKKESFQGSGIKGPYKLGALNIIENSEVVTKKSSTESAETTLARDKDYTINYFEGSITFSEIVSQQETITVSYEFSFPDLIFRTGEVMGFQTNYDISKNSSINTFFINEKSNSGGGLTSSSTSDPTIYSYQKNGDDTAPLYNEYPLLNWPVISRSESVFINNSLMPEIYNVVGETDDYVIDYNRGTISFVQPYTKKDGSIKNPPGFSKQDIINASYSYSISFAYEATLDLSVDKPIPSDTNTYEIPASINSYIRYPDRIRVWKNNKNDFNNLLSPGTIGNTPTNYVIKLSDKGVYTITFYFTPDPTDKYIIEYRDSPSTNSSSASSVKKNVMGLTYNLTYKNKFTLKTQIAQSNGEKETLGIGASESFNGVITDPATQTLETTFTVTQNKDVSGNILPLVPDSEKITLLPSGIILSRGGVGRVGQYYIDYNIGKIILIKDYAPKVGEQITVSYSYFPSADSLAGSIENIIGKAIRIDGATKLFGGDLNFVYRKVEPQYIPVSAARPLPELGQITFSSSYPLGKYLTVSGSYDKKRTPTLDLTGINTTGEVSQSLTGGGAISFAYKKLPKVTYNFSLQKINDNLDIHKIDNKNISQAISLIKEFKKYSTSFDYKKNKSENNLPNTQDLEDIFYDFKINMQQTKRMGFNFDYQVRNTKTIFSETDIRSSETAATTLGTSINIGKTFILRNNLSIQQLNNQTDPAHIQKYTLKNIEVTLSSTPITFKKIKLQKDPFEISYISFSIRREYNPGTIPATTTESYMNTVTLKPYSTLSFTPTYSKTSSKNESQVGNESTTLNFNTIYKPKSKYSLSLSNAFSKTNSNAFTLANDNTITSTGTTNKNLSFDFSFIPKNKIEILLHWDSQTTKSPASSYSTSNPRMDLTYVLNKKSKLVSRFFQTKQKGDTANSKKSELDFSLEYSFSEKSKFITESRFLFVNEIGNKYNANIITARWEIGF